MTNEHDPWKDALDRLPRELPPPRDLWPQIRMRVQAEAAVRRAERGAPAGQRWAIAAGLVFALTAGSVGVSYLRHPPEVRPALVEVARVEDPNEAYGDAIAELEVELALRRDGLRPETVAVVEENLRIIDQAIERSRQVLAQDPGREGVVELLASAYDAKLALLRQAAMAAIAEQDSEEN